MAADIGARDWQGAGVGVFTPRDSAQVFFLSLDPFLPYVRAHSSHISTLNSFFRDAASKPIPQMLVLIFYDLPNRDCAAMVSPHHNNT